MHLSGSNPETTDSREIWRSSTPKRLLAGLEPYLYVLPAITVFVVFTIAPLLFAFYLSLTDWDLISANYNLVGLDNFEKLANDTRFWRSVRNTIYFAAGTIPVQILLALGTAVLLNSKLKLQSFFRGVFFLPVIVPITVAAVVWLFIFSPSFGLLNYLLNTVGLASVGWFSDPQWALPAIMILAIWQNFGYHTVIYLAGLQAIPQQLLEAAYIDGATKWQAFWRITFPLLGPTTFLVLILSIIGGFQVYQTVVLTTGGGPAGATTVIVFELYRNAFEFFNMGYASAIAVLLFFLLFSLTLIQFKFLGSRIHYG